MPSFKDNVKFLNSFIVRAPQANKNKIQTIADLYEQKKIVNFKTALKTTMLLASTNKSVIKSGKADKEFEKVFNKYDLAVPMPGRIQRQMQEKKQELERKTNEAERKRKRAERRELRAQRERERKHRNELIEDQIQQLHTELLGSNSKDYFIDVILHKNTEEEKYEKAAYKQAKATGTKYYKGLIQVYAGQKHMEFKSESAGSAKKGYETAVDNTMMLRELQYIKRTYNTYHDFLEYCEGKLITVSKKYLGREPTERELNVFFALKNVYLGYVIEPVIAEYVSGILIKKLMTLDLDDVEPHEPETKRARETSKVSMKFS